MNTANILGIKFSDVTLNQSVEIAMGYINNKQKGYVVTPNSEIAYLCKDDSELKQIVNNASLILPDGIGIIYAAKILKQTLHGKVAGIDFAENMIKQSAEQGKSVFFLGAKPGVAQKAADIMCEKYKGLIVSGTCDGYFKEDHVAIDAINSAGGADIVIVCLGAPRQEKFIAKNIDKTNATLMCGFGGALDVWAGNVQRAPDIFIKLGLEWFYRLCKEPYRIGRMMSLPKFMLCVIKAKITNKF